jgi:hypothetical protein
MRFPLLLLTMTVLAVSAEAQDEELTRPPDWIVRFDRPAADSAIYFVDMPPGWHITTGPSAILYDPAMTASGTYHLRSEIFLFPGERLEGYGVIFGGSDLQGDGQVYTYFLLRKDGRFLVKERRGSETETLVPWTAHRAVVPHEGGEDPVKNVVEVDVGADDVTFIVNGETVHRLDRAAIAVDGIVGLRVNHRLNLHVASLTVE